MLNRFKFFILFLTISLTKLALAEDFLFEGKAIHPICIASLIPSLAEQEVDYADIVELEQCMTSSIPVTSQNLKNINKHIINYKNGIFMYSFLGNIYDYSFFETLIQSSTGTAKNIVVAKYTTQNSSKNKHNLALYDIITSGNKCNGSIVGNKIKNNEFFISQLVSPALFLSIATNKDEIQGLGKFDRSNDSCIGTVTQIYNIKSKELTLYNTEINSELYVKNSQNKSKEQICFNKLIESINNNILDNQQTQDIAKKIISDCLL